MEILSVGVPSILNDVLDSLGLKDVKLFSFFTKWHKIYIFVQYVFFSGSIVFFTEHSCLAQKVHRVLNFVDFAFIFDLGISFEFIFREYQIIHLSDIEVRPIIGSNAVLFIGVITRPVIKIKANIENLAVE